MARGVDPLITRSDVQDFFSELAESDDEKIRESLLEYLHTLPNHYAHSGVCDPEWIAWIKKQGEQKPYGQRQECTDCQFNYAGECKGSCAMKRGEKKPADNAKQKFNVGDWIVDKLGNTLYVKEVYDSFSKVIDRQYRIYNKVKQNTK